MTEQLLHLSAQSKYHLSNVLVAIPAFNEERFIGSVVLQAKQFGCPVLVIDDGSSDHTADIAQAAGAVVQRHETNRGKSEALNSAFSFAQQVNAEALVVLDGDGQHEVGAVPRVVQPILSGAADMVVGSRFLATSNGKTPRVRRLGQQWVTFATNAGSGMPITDSQSGFRAFSRRAVEALVLLSQGFGAEVEMQFRARELGLTVQEVPIRAIYTDPPKRNVFGQGLEVLNRVLNLTGRHRPLMSFSILAAALLIFGLAGIVLPVPSVMPANFAAVSGQLALMAIRGSVLCLFTGFVLHAVRGNQIEMEKRLQVIRGEHLQLNRRRTDHLQAPDDSAPMLSVQASA